MVDEQTEVKGEAATSAGSSNETKQEAKLETKSQAPPPVAAKQADPPAPRANDDEEDEPTADDKGNITLPQSQFIRRVSRMSRKALRAAFGTEDLDAIVAERKELVTLKAEKAELARKEMSEKERAQHDLAKERERAVAADLRADAAEEREVVRETGRSLKELALDFVDKDDAEDVLDKLASHIRRHPGEVETQANAKEWLQEFVVKHPKWGKAQPEDKAAKKPLDTGVKGAAKHSPPPSGDDSQDRTARPGQANTMSKKEIRERHGVSW